MQLINVPKTPLALPTFFTTSPKFVKIPLQKITVRRYTYQHDDNEQVGGDRRLQEALATVVQIEVTKARAKEQLDTAVENERGRLIEAAEQAIQEIDRIADSADKRSESAFNNAMENIDTEFEDYYKELQDSRKQMEEDRAEFEEFQKQMVEDRSRGQFFKQLYQSDLPKEKDQKSRSRVSPQVRRKLRQKIYRQAYDESKRPLRLGLFSFLTIMLGSQIFLDLSSESASYGLDALYLMLALIFGAYAWKERYYIIQARQLK